jgi:hypothetical protein
MPIVEAETTAIEAGRRRFAHRKTEVEGAEQVATERCNIDDVKYPPRPIDNEQLALAFREHRACRWCFPGQPR